MLNPRPMSRSRPMADLLVIAINAAVLVACGGRADDLGGTGGQRSKEEPVAAGGTESSCADEDGCHCTIASDCFLRNGLACCERCEGNEWMALSKDQFDIVSLCGAGQVQCP